MATIVFTLEDGSSITTPLDTDLITIGRDEDSIVQLRSPSVSSQHAIIKAREDGYYVQDIGSRNGTRVNGAVIEESILTDGDRVAFGDVTSIFYASDEVPAESVPNAVAFAIPEPEVVVPLVVAAPPVTGIPHRAPGPQVRSWQRRGYTGEGSGCMTGIILTILFGGAFLIGLSLRHYKETNGGVLPNDIIKKVMGNVKIEIKEDEKK
jgi:hypothetical protein